jgi:hypothetical protein
MRDRYKQAEEEAEGFEKAEQDNFIIVKNAQ